MSCFVYTSPEGKSDILTKHNESVLHRWIEHELVVIFITYYTFDVHLMGVCMFTLGTLVYKRVVQAMWSLFRDHIAWDHIETNHSM